MIIFTVVGGDSTDQGLLSEDRAGYPIRPFEICADCLLSLLEELEVCRSSELSDSYQLPLERTLV